MTKRWTRFVPEPLWLWWIEHTVRWEFANDIKAAEAANDQNRVAELEAQYRFELGDIVESRQVIIQRKLTRKAERFGIAVPQRMFEHEDLNWYDTPNGALLKPETMLKLRREVRAEEKERFELRTRWISLWIGLIGALTGLVSVLVK